MSKAVYRSDCRDKHDRPRWDSNLGPLAPQSGVLTLSHRDPHELRSSRKWCSFYGPPGMDIRLTLTITDYISCTWQTLYVKIYRVTWTQWNGTVFPVLVRISCVAPGTTSITIRIAAVVACCRHTPVRIVWINICSWISRSLCPRTTRISIYSRCHRSHVLTPQSSRFAFWWTKQTFARYVRKIYYTLLQILMRQKSKDLPHFWWISEHFRTL